MEHLPNKEPDSEAQSAHFSFKEPFAQTSKLFFWSAYSTLNTRTAPVEKPIGLSALLKGMTVIVNGSSLAAFKPATALLTAQVYD